MKSHPLSIVQATRFETAGNVFPLTRAGAERQYEDQCQAMIEAFSELFDVCRGVNAPEHVWESRLELVLQNADSNKCLRKQTAIVLVSAGDGGLGVVGYDIAAGFKVTTYEDDPNNGTHVLESHEYGWQHDPAGRQENIDNGYAALDMLTGKAKDPQLNANSAQNIHDVHQKRMHERQETFANVVFLPSYSGPVSAA